uniref:Serine/threonine protein phosphatase 2A regulatory subunit n=1 Tax=Glossina brevipalpis TaxID=37001 RepID=A0A1A9WPJ0_9MUSC
MALYLTKNVKNLLEKSSPTKRKEKIQSRSRYGISSNKNSRLEHLETLNIHQRINDGEISFVCKLRQCRILYDFNDREADLEGKQIKSEILQDIIDYLAQVRGVLSLTAYNEVIDMFSCNVFHTLPSIHITEAERKEDVSVEDVAWPHLKLVYQVFHNFLYSPGFKAVRAENFLNNKFISELLRLFNSEDNRERIALRNILSGIYCKFINKRNFIRKEVENIFLSYVYEDKYCNGIPQLLEIVPRIIMEFYRTSNGECSEFLTKVLLPLHKGKYFVLYHIRLVRCLLMYLTKYPVLFEPIVRQLLLVWPKSCAEKEIMFLEEIEILFQAVNVPEFMKVHDSLFRQIMKCIQSPHFQVSKYALILWSNKTFKRLINKITVVALPTIITTLYCSSKFHWHKQIREFSHFYLKVFLSDNFTTFYKSSYSDYRKLWENLEANLDLIKIGEICNNTKEQWSRKFLNPDHSVPFQYIEFHLSAFEHLLTSYAINQRQHEIGDSRTKILDQFYIRSTYPGSLCSHILICDNIPLSNIDTGSHSTRLQPTQQYIQNLQQLKEEQKGHKQPQVQTKPETEHRNLQQQDQKQPQLRKNLRLQHEDVPQQQMLQHQKMKNLEEIDDIEDVMDMIDIRIIEEHPVERRSPTKRKKNKIPTQRYGNAFSEHPQLHPLRPLNPLRPALCERNLFVRKLMQGRVLFDFMDPFTDIKGKTIKTGVLSNLAVYLANAQGILTEAMFYEVLTMIAVNIFHTLPAHQRIESERKDNVSVEEVCWEHLMLIYEVFYCFVHHSEFKPEYVEVYFDEPFLMKLIQLFDTEIEPERYTLTNILTNVFGKCPSRREFIRKTIVDIFLAYIYEEKEFNGVSELLQIFQLVIMEFGTILNYEYFELLMRVLLPLHIGRFLSIYYINLSSCVILYIKKYSVLAENVIKQLLLFWPRNSSEKQIIFLEEIDTILEIIQLREFEGVEEILFRQLGECAKSPHMLVSKSALRIWRNTRVRDLVEESDILILPIIVPALYVTTKTHWNKYIVWLAQDILRKYLMRNGQLFYDLTYQDHKEQWKALHRAAPNFDMENEGRASPTTVPSSVQMNSSLFQELLATYTERQHQRDIQELRLKFMKQYTKRSGPKLSLLPTDDITSSSDSVDTVLSQITNRNALQSRAQQDPQQNEPKEAVEHVFQYDQQQEKQQDQQHDQHQELQADELQEGNQEKKQKLCQP